MVPAHTVINRMLALFRQNSTKRSIALTEEFHTDLNWFLPFLSKFNGITYTRKSDIPGGQTLHVDASLIGLGEIWNNEVYAIPIFDIYDKNYPSSDAQFGHSPQAAGQRLGPL